MGKRMELAQTAQAGSGFNERLAALRKAAGFTQVELAGELGISQRMMAYYESPNATPPAHLLPAIAKALGVSIDDLYGHGTPKRPGWPSKRATAACAAGCSRSRSSMPTRSARCCS